MTKQEILEKAETLLMQPKTYDLDLGFLARHCGIGKANLYAIFESKRNLLFLLLAHICKKEKENITYKLSQKAGIEKINCFFDQYFSILEKVPYNTIQNLVKQSWESKKEIGEFSQWIKNTYQEILLEMKAGSAGFSLEEANVLAEMLLVQMNHYYSNLWKIKVAGTDKIYKNQIIRCFSL